MLAKLLTADEALSLGVMTEIVPAEQLETRVGEVADRLTTTRPADPGGDQGVDSPHPGRARVGQSGGRGPDPLLLHERRFP